MKQEDIIEIWRDIPGRIGFYQISNKGKVKSLSRGIISGRGGVKIIPERILVPVLRKGGYLYVNLCINGKVKMESIHRLVANNFISNTTNKPQINHINGIKTDNRVENLEWCTASENQNHAIRTGLIVTRVGEDKASAKLKNEQVLKIRNLLETTNMTHKQIAEIYGVTRGTISYIAVRSTWNHL